MFMIHWSLFRPAGWLRRFVIRPCFKFQPPMGFRLLDCAVVHTDKVVIMPGGQGGSGLTDFADEGIIHGSGRGCRL